jgi:hypothetical protein
MTTYLYESREMAEVAEIDESRGCWKDLIVLLRGDMRAGATASQVLADILIEVELPEVFHELCTLYLTAKDWMARSNAGATIKCLCRKFASILIPLLTRSKSDGELLTLSELDVSAVSNCENAILLGGHSYPEKQAEGSELYSKSWLQKQRRALRKRLGLEALTADDAVAVDYISFEVLVDDGDLTRTVHHPSPSTSTGAHSRRDKKDNAPSIPDYQRKAEDSSDVNMKSSETWLARCTIYLILLSIVLHVISIDKLFLMFAMHHKVMCCHHIDDLYFVSRYLSGT